MSGIAVTAPALQVFVRDLLVAGGIGADDADVVAVSLVGANLRGHDSHGVMRVPSYVAAVADGRLDPAAELVVLSETGAVLVCDAGWGLGQVQGRRLVLLLAPKARAYGVACGTLRRSGHVGRVGEYAEQAASLGLVLIGLVNTHGAGPRVAPTGGIAPRLGTNPLCIGVPAADGPVILDFGTSATAEGKVRVHKIAGTSCPPGWLIDAVGQPTTDPNVLYAMPPGSIVPMGGEQSYKGFGLALLIDMLAGGLSGGRTMGPDPGPPLGNDVLFIVLDPARFGGAEHFAQEIQTAAAYVRDCPRREDVDEILLPGDPERRTLTEREARGIPIDTGNWAQLTTLAAQLSIATPEVRVA